MRRNVVTHDERPLFAFGLRRLRRPPAGGHADDPIQHWVRTLTALEGYRGIDVVLDWSARPSASRGHGRLDITLLVCDRRGDQADVAELQDDVADLLHAQSHLYEFEPLGRDEIRERLGAVAPGSVAEVTRRVEVVSNPGRAVGFGVDDAIPDSIVTISLWPGQVDQLPSREGLATALLSQGEPVSVRFLVRPTELSPDELMTVGRRADRMRQVDSPLSAAGAAALSTLLRARPAFEIQVLVASDRRLSPACISAVGFAMSPPASWDTSTVRLAGGFDAVRELHGGGPLAEAFARLRPVPVGADTPLGRLPRIMDAWQAAAAARPPVASDGTFTGMDVGMASVAPTGVRVERDGLLLGDTPAGGRVTLPHDDRMRHTYMLGQTGTGKSTLMLSMIADDLASDRGVAVIDPHGDLVDAALALVPEHRWDDVVLVEPTDQSAVVGINLLQADSDVQREFLVSELCEWMYALYDPRRQGIVGPRFEAMLRYAALLLIEDERDWSLMEIPRLFTDHAFTKQLVDRAEDPLVREFWANDSRNRKSNEYAEVAAWFRSKFEPFRSVASLRRVLGQTSSTVNVADVMDRGGILFAKLSKGLLGEYNARLLGFVVFARLWAATMARAQVPAAQRREFHVYLDEAQTITTSSLPTILSEARKYGVSATLGNQFFGQIPEDLRESVLGNVGTKLAFRMGATDAAAFAAHYGPEIDPQQLRRLPNFEVLADVLVGGEPEEVQHLRTVPVLMPHDADERGDAVRHRSRRNWATPVRWIDDDFAQRYAGRAVCPEPTPTTSFLDDWLERRRAEVDGAQEGGTT